MALLLPLKMHIVMLNINSLKHPAYLFTGVYVGTLALKVCQISMLHGVKASENC